MSASQERLAGAREPLLEVVERILIGAVETNFKMQVGTGGVAGRALRSDGLAPLHLLAHTYEDGRKVRIQRRVAIAMCDQHIVAVAAAPAVQVHKRHDARVGSSDRGRVAGRDVEPRVEVAGWAVGVVGLA